MTDPKVTAIILLYNDAPHGLKAIDSVIAQTLKNIKIKILDNGSTDDTWDQIQKYASDPRVTLVRNTRNQKSEFAAYELLKTDTEYLSLLFSDDFYMPERLELAMKNFDSNPDLDAVFFNNQFIDERGTILRKIPPTLFSGDISNINQFGHLQNLFFRGNSLHPCAMVAKTAAYKKLGGFRPYFHRIGDMIFFTRLLAHGKLKFVPEKMQKITVWSTGRNESSQNSSTWNKLIYERQIFLQEYLAQNVLDNVVKIFGETKEIAEHKFIEDAEKLWYLGHQALSSRASDYRIFGFKCLYLAADKGSKQFYDRIFALTGKTIPQYLDDLGDSLPPYREFLIAYRFKRFFIELVKKVPLTIRLYRWLTGNKISEVVGHTDQLTSFPG